MFITGPDVIKVVTHEDVSKDDLGGASTHKSRSGVAHFAVNDDQECLRLIRELVSFVPSNNMEDPPSKVSEDSLVRSNDKLDDLIPTESNQPYDMKEIISEVVDDNYFFEVHALFARNIIVGFAR